MDNFVLNLPFSHWPALRGTEQECERALFRFFETQNRVVVLANSNVLEDEVDVAGCKAHGVPVLTRKGGGGTVVLMPGCLVLTFAFLAQDVFSNNLYFSKINSLWIEALGNLGISGLSQGGISDIVAGSRKIAGTSLFRKKHLVVYQGSLLVDPDFELIGSCLKHPTREPDYRKRRSHSDFLTSVKALGFTHSSGDLATHCQSYFNDNVAATLRGHFLLS